MPQLPRKVLAALALCVGLGSVIVAYPAFHRDQIYPGVSVRDVQLGGLTVEEAAMRLANARPLSATRSLKLQGSARSWEFAPAAAGREVDCARTAAAAYQVARVGPWHERTLSAWRVILKGRAIEPLIRPADPDLVRTLLDSIARHIHVPATDAALEIGQDGVTCVPGTAGRALDVEATTEAVINALANDVAEVKLITVILPPDRLESEPGCTDARSLLSHPFQLVADDPLTDYEAVFEAPPGRVATWLQAVPATDQVVLEIDETLIEKWLLEIAPELGPERILDVEETLRRASAALQDREHLAASVIRHPDTTYVVQAGDTLFDIAYAQGFPQWRLEAANPDVEPGELLIGMELTIPSIDVLFPEPLVPGRRIEIDLPEQRLRAYENGALAYDFTCSSGISTTPTIAGQFQVLFKEREAHAQRWSLEMPYFMAVYYEGPDFANGIHELPITADGHRLWAGYLGWPASYGCIILDVGDAEKLYNWAPVGTLVRIEGVAPGTPTYEERLEQLGQ